MKAVHIFCLCILLMLTCHVIAQDVDAGDRYEFVENGLVQYDSVKMNHTTFSIQEGEYTVFIFSSNNNGDPGNHSVASTQLVFQVKTQGSKFQLEDKDLNAGSAIYMQLCRCADRGIQRITGGTISGKRSGHDAWTIELDVEAMGRKTKKNYRFRHKANYKRVTK